MVDLAFRLRRQQRPNRVRLGSTQPLPAKPQSKAEHPQVRQAQAAEVLGAADDRSGNLAFFASD